MYEAKTATPDQHAKVQALVDDINDVIASHVLRGADANILTAAAGQVFNDVVLKQAVQRCSCGSPDCSRGDRDDLLNAHRKLWDDEYTEDHKRIWAYLQFSRKIVSALGTPPLRVAAAWTGGGGKPFKTSTLDDVIEDLLRAQPKT